MPLVPCTYRQPDGDDAAYRCTLVQQILGLGDATECRVEPAGCRACAQLSQPTAARPNAVVSSLVHVLARRIRQQGGWPQCDPGRAWQSQSYVRNSLAEEHGSAVEGELAEEQRGADVNGAEAAPLPPLHASQARSGDERERLDEPLPRAVRRMYRGGRPRIGLVGYASASGLGQLNRDLAEQGGVDRWLVVDHPRFPTLGPITSRCRVERFGPDDDAEKLRRWLERVDWVLWAEACPIPWLPQLAREAGVRIACIPMWELTAPTAPWLRGVDVLICPTQQAYEIFVGWKRRFGFRWTVAKFPWPMATSRFRFRVRQQCQRFVFVNGRGGAAARCIDSSRTLGRRKGLDVVLAAARLAPEIPWIVYTQHRMATEVPANVHVRHHVDDNESLYDEGDVCVQPSRWEGLGLPLLECQAAGMPLVTIDAAPMNEYRPLRSLAPSGWTWGYLCDGQPIHIPAIAPAALADAVRELYGQNISEASIQARAWVTRERSWARAIGSWRRLFQSWPFLEVSDNDDIADA